MTEMKPNTASIIKNFRPDDAAGHQQEWESLLRTAKNIPPANAGILHLLENRNNLAELKRQIAAIIDHTVLKPETTSEMVRQICYEAAQHGFASVCVNPNFVDLCREELAGTGILIATVIGFPLGANDTEVKAYEAEQAVNSGAHELDMVLPVGYLKDGQFEYARKDIEAVVRAAGGKTVKVILENCLLSQDEIVTGSLIARDAGAHFVKTSTGFNKSGADAGDIALMRKTVGLDMGVKAAGGIRSLDDALDMVLAGASRIGASSSVQIVS